MVTFHINCLTFQSKTKFSNCSIFWFCFCLKFFLWLKMLICNCKYFIFWVHPLHVYICLAIDTASKAKKQFQFFFPLSLNFPVYFCTLTIKSMENTRAISYHGNRQNFWTLKILPSGTTNYTCFFHTKNTDYNFHATNR